MDPERARCVYRALLRLAAPALRRRYAREMEALFLERLAGARAAGRWRAVGAWSAAIGDLMASRLRSSFQPSAVSSGWGDREALMPGSDLKYTWRWLSRQRPSTALVVFMLALAMAANVVVFSLVNGIFLRPFPFPQADRLVYINETAPKWNLEFTGINYPDLHQWKADARLFEAIALFEQRTFNVADASGPERIDGAAVTADFARVLGVEPLSGRMFTADEDRPNAPRVVVLGEGLWRERFGAGGDAVGQMMKINGVSHEIVGVMPAVAEFPGNVRLWVPMAGDPNSESQNYLGDGFGRLKPGVTAAQAEEDLRRAHEPIWSTRDTARTVSPLVRPLRDQFARHYEQVARLLFATVALLLVVASANVASVLLARALARRREMGIRLAVGATRLRLVRQLLLENVVLAALGGLLGVALGSWALSLLVAAADHQLPSWASFEIDAPVLGYSVALVAGTVMLFGWAPVLHALRADLRGAMQQSGTAATAAGGSRRTLRLLLAGEFALATLILVVSSLLVQAYQRVQRVDPGFRVDGVLTFSIALPDATYPEDAARLAFWDRLVDRLSGAPGVHAAGLVSCRPFGCHWGTLFEAEGALPRPPDAPNPVVLFRPATPGYFEAMSIRLKRGRLLDARDVQGGERVAVVNETFAKTFWPGEADVVGRRFRGTDPGAPWMTVVGVVQDVQHYGLERPMRPGIYQPLVQSPSTSMAVAVRTSGDPGAFIPSARAIVRELDPELPLFSVRTMEEALAASLAERKLYSWLIGVFAAIAVALALGGVYGVSTYLVSQRTREMGIRVALGAARADIVRATLRQALVPVGAGVALGVVAGLAAGRLLGDLLFGVPPHDPAALAAASLVVSALAILVNLWPARRAASVDPMECLRAD